MLLSKDGITVEVIHPADIARYKHLGYVEASTPEELNEEAIRIANASKGTPKTPGKPSGRQSSERPDKVKEGGEE